MFKTFISIVSKIFVVSALILVVGGSVITPTVSAQDGNFVGVGDCDPGETKIDADDIFRPTSFIPIIPDSCAVCTGVDNPEDEIREGGCAEGQARALSFELIPIVMIRSFGLILGTVGYFFGFMLIFSGVQYMWGGVDGNSDKKALRNIQDSIIAILLVVGSYIIVFTILDLLRIQDFNTDLTTFFN